VTIKIAEQSAGELHMSMAKIAAVYWEIAEMATGMTAALAEETLILTRNSAMVEVLECR